MAGKRSFARRIDECETAVIAPCCITCAAADKALRKRAPRAIYWCLAAELWRYTATSIEPMQTPADISTLGLANALGEPDHVFAKVEFELKDAIALKHTYIEHSHKFWSYFQLAFAASAGYAWQATAPLWGVLAGLLVAFGAFSAANRRLIYDTQRAAFEVSEAIDAHLRASGQQRDPLIAIANTRKPDSPAKVYWLHVGLSVLGLALIAARIFERLPAGWWREFVVR